MNSVVLVETSLSEASKQSSAGNNKAAKGCPPNKTNLVRRVFKSFQEKYGDQVLDLDALERELFKEYPDQFDSEKWRFVLKGKAFKEAFEFSKEENWIRLKDSSSED